MIFSNFLECPASLLGYHGVKRRSVGLRRARSDSTFSGGRASFPMTDMGALAEALEASMNETVPRVQEESAERRSRFISENLRRIFVQIYRIVGNADDAQDLTQEAFIKALQREDQLKDSRKAAHWLSRIATNTALDFVRRRGRVAFCDVDDLPEPLRSPAAQSPEQLLLRSEQQAWLQAGLDELTDRERAALVLRDVEGLPAGEVARRLNCSKATVRSHIANARIKFRRYMVRRQS